MIKVDVTKHSWGKNKITIIFDRKDYQNEHILTLCHPIWTRSCGHFLIELLGQNPFLRVVHRMRLCLFMSRHFEGDLLPIFGTFNYHFLNKSENAKGGVCDRYNHYFYLCHWRSRPVVRWAKGLHSGWPGRICPSPLWCHSTPRKCLFLTDRVVVPEL